MARINIDDNLIASFEFMNLTVKLNSPLLAMGALVFAIKKAEEFCLNSNTGFMIPENEYKKILHNEELLDLGFFEKIGDFYRIKNDEKHFNWLRQKSNAGKSKSTKKLQKLEKTRSLKASNMQDAHSIIAQEDSSLSERTLNGDERTSNGSKPLTLTLTPTLTPTLTQNYLNNSISSVADKSTTKPDSLVLFFLDQEEVRVSLVLYKKWINLYEETFVVQERKKAEAWLLANKHKAPRKNYTRFFNTWLDKGWESYRKTIPGNGNKELIMKNNDEIMKRMLEKGGQNV